MEGKRKNLRNPIEDQLKMSYFNYEKIEELKLN